VEEVIRSMVIIVYLKRQSFKLSGKFQVLLKLPLCKDSYFFLKNKLFFVFLTFLYIFASKKQRKLYFIILFYET